MGAHTLRNRVSGTITALDLTNATAANRAFDVILGGAKGADAGGTRFFGFEWVKTTSQVVTVTVSKIDTLDANKEVILETASDAGATSGTWQPDEEEVAGYDPEAPGSVGITYRLQFSQAGGACSASPKATFKGV